MTPNQLERLSQLVSEKIGERVVFVSAEQIGSGYHSDGFRLTAENGRMFFLKKQKSHDLGFEYPERKLSSLLVSHRMAERSGTDPKLVGVFIESGDEIGAIPDLNDDSVVYHIQEFAGDGESYWSRLLARKSKTAMDDDDRKEIREIVDYITCIHRIMHPSSDPDRLKAVYNDHLRSMLGHPELTLTMFHEFPADHPIFPVEEQGKHLGRMIKLMHEWKDRSDRLTALHGDFWGANTFFREDGSLWVIDHSRIPWGDPGVDVAWWLAQYVWHHNETGNPYFKELGNYFLDQYITATGDQDIRKAVCLTLGTLAPIYTSPRFYPNLDKEAGTRFYTHVRTILEQGVFHWIA